MSERSPIDPALVGLTWAYLRREKERGSNSESPPRSIGSGIRQHPGRTTLALIAALTVAHVINLGRQVIEDQARIAAITASASETPNLVPSIGSSGDEPKLGIIPPRPDDLIRQYINDHINNKLKAAEFNKLWGITQTELVQITPNKPNKSVKERDFPDTRLGKITGELTSDENQPLPGVFRYFIVVQKPNSKDISIWTVRWVDENGKYQLRTIPVYEDGEWLASFINEDSAVFGKTIDGEILFERAYPPVELPKIKSIVL